jgi:beta-glucosidase
VDENSSITINKYDSAIDELISLLTLEEKASLLSGKNFWETMDIPRKGIPSLFLADGPHGIRKQQAAADHLGLNISIPATCFPTAATVANSWNVDLVEQMGHCLGVEARTLGVNVLLGPGINIKRNPLCGRNFEYYSEDPYLTGKLASSLVRGIQKEGVAACVKHYAVNNQETNRMAINAIVDERALRELYLTAFEMVVREGNVLTLMTAYNRINGIYANEHLYLLRKVLREEWGFDGLIITDWGGSNERIDGLLASSDLEMPGTNGESDRELVTAVQEGRLSEQFLNESVGRLLSLSNKLSRAPVHNVEPKLFDVSAHHAIARQVAEESIVLLKNNDGILPLQEGQKVALIGDFAQKPRYQGAGSSNVNPTTVPNLLELIGKSKLDVIGFAQGYDRYGKANKRLLNEAVQLARTAEVVVLCIGLDEASEAEGLDRPHMALPQNQIALIHALSEIQVPIVAILFCGSVVEMPWIESIKAVLHGYLPGQAGAEAILNVLTGKVNPSGKLAETYPCKYEDIPSASMFPAKEATAEYRESLFVGYRYFDRFPEKILFPFGFGLSYTSFKYYDLQVSGRGVSFSIQNTGHNDGSEIAQLYVRKPTSSIFRPEKELKGFVKVFLRAGETRQVCIPFDEYTFRFFDVHSKRWLVEEGDYELWIGASSQDIRLKGSIFREGVIVKEPYSESTLSTYYHGDPARVSREEFQTLYGAALPVQLWDRNKPLTYNDTVVQCQYAQSLFARFVFHIMDSLPSLLRKIGKRNQANLIMMSFYYMPFRGITKMMGGMVNRAMAEGLLTVANGHFFRGIKSIIKEYRKLRKAGYAKQRT